MLLECLICVLYEEHVTNWLVAVHMRRMTCAEWYRKCSRSIYKIL